MERNEYELRTILTVIETPLGSLVIKMCLIKQKNISTENSCRADGDNRQKCIVLKISALKLSQSVHVWLIRKDICINRDVPKCCFRYVVAPDCCDTYPSWSLVGSTEQNSGNSIHFLNDVCGATMDPSSLLAEKALVIRINIKVRYWCKSQRRNLEVRSRWPSLEAKGQLNRPCVWSTKQICSE